MGVHMISSVRVYMIFNVCMYIVFLSECDIISDVVCYMTSNDGIEYDLQCASSKIFNVGLYMICNT